MYTLFFFLFRNLTKIMYVNLFFSFQTRSHVTGVLIFTLFSVTYYVCLYSICTTRMPARPRRIVCATIYYIDRSSSNTIEFQASVLRFLRSQPTTCLAGRPPHSLTSLARPPRAVGAGRVYYILPHEGHHGGPILNHSATRRHSISYTK